MSHKRVAIASFALLLLWALPAHGSEIELGLDGSVGYCFVDDSDYDFVEASLPVHSVRAGLFVTDVLSVEPSLAFDLVSDDDETITNLGLGAEVLYHLQRDPQRTRVFVAAGPSMVLTDVDESRTQFGVCGQVGVKIPMRDSLGVRVAAGYQHMFENDDFRGENRIFGSFGFSFFTG